MSLARAIVFFAGFLALDVAAAFVLLVVAGAIAPKGTGTGLSLLLGALLVSMFVIFAASAALYLRMLPAADLAPAGRWMIGIAFVVALALLYLASVVVTLLVFNR